MCGFGGICGGWVMASEAYDSVTVASLTDEGVVVLNDGYRMKNSELGPSGYPFVRGGDIRDGQVITDVEDHIVDMQNSGVQVKVSRPGDVAFITKGTVGRVGFLREGQPPVVFAPQVCIWRALDHKRLNPRFLFYLLCGHEFQSNLNAVMSHGAMAADYVSLSDQRSFRLTLPPVGAQRGIAEVLGAIDDKIDLIRRMNATLEAMARALFKSWFVDFDPVRAKMEGREPDGMDAETARLFPAELVESEAGEVPKGWTIRPLSDVVDVNPPRQLRGGTEAPYLDMGNMPIDGHRALDWYPRAVTSGMKFVNGDTLVARITPCLENGKTAFVDFLEEGEVGWGSTEYIVLHPQAGLPPAWAYYLARTERFRLHAIQSMTGSSGRQRVASRAFDQFFVAVPSAPVAVRWGADVKRWMDQIAQNAKQSRTLAALRDALLPKLLSGELRVKDAERVVGAVV